jgi:hypothetical protein
MLLEGCTCPASTNSYMITLRTPVQKPAAAQRAQACEQLLSHAAAAACAPQVLQAQGSALGFAAHKPLAAAAAAAVVVVVVAS